MGQSQLEWLEQDLAGNSRAHTVVISHFPPWNGRFSSIYKMSSDEETIILKDILHRYSVDYVFAAHYHGYDEATLGGVKYVVTGGANDILDPGHRRHYVRVSISGSSISMQRIDLP